MTRPARFTKPDLRRAADAVREAGLSVTGVEISPDGTIRILTGALNAANDRNPLDRVLSR